MLKFRLEWSLWQRTVSTQLNQRGICYHRAFILPRVTLSMPKTVLLPLLASGEYCSGQDLADADCCDKLLSATKDLQVEFLVNNAGFSTFGHFAELPIDSHP